MEETLKQQVKEIFKIDNLPAISYFLNQFISLNTERVLETEYMTIIAAAKSDARREFIQEIIDNINS